jgi:hypothetical protein
LAGANYVTGIFCAKSVNKGYKFFGALGIFCKAIVFSYKVFIKLGGVVESKKAENKGSNK